MKLFGCQHCGQRLYFENTACVRCKHRLGFIPSLMELSALEPAGEGLWYALAAPGLTKRFCDNAERDACNWLVPSDSTERFCKACRHNRTVPNLSEEANLRDWRKMELAKHRLIYTLLRLDLPLPNRADDAKAGLVFDFLADPPEANGAKVLTGHDEGLITLALKEADDAERETRRKAMGEPYRTLLGHFRHEVGHYYWDRLVRDGGHLAECRALFGDDEASYEEALKRHYKEGAPADWQQHFVSTYATTHAWEDFAETWAHYLHIVDSLETASAFGLEVHPTSTPDPDLHVAVHLDPYREQDFDRLIAAWLPLTYAMNQMNRSMGLGDLYPFILSADAIRKLAFVHALVHARPGERISLAAATPGAEAGSAVADKLRR
jgi:hypothetical protein